jgi:hypothetical protein
VLSHINRKPYKSRVSGVEKVNKVQGISLETIKNRFSASLAIA